MLHADSYLCLYLFSFLLSIFAYMSTIWKYCVHGLDILSKVRIIVAGDFKNIDQTTPTWLPYCYDVNPFFDKYFCNHAASKLDRYLLIPEDWVTAAQWTPVLRSLRAHTPIGHRILRLNILIKPIGNTLSFLAARLCLEVWLGTEVKLFRALSGYCTGKISALESLRPTRMSPRCNNYKVHN